MFRTYSVVPVCLHVPWSGSRFGKTWLVMIRLLERVVGTSEHWTKALPTVFFLFLLKNSQCWLGSWDKREQALMPRVIHLLLIFQWPLPSIPFSRTCHPLTPIENRKSPDLRNPIRLYMSYNTTYKHISIYITHVMPLTPRLFHPLCYSNAFAQWTVPLSLFLFLSPFLPLTHLSFPTPPPCYLGPLAGFSAAKLPLSWDSNIATQKPPDKLEVIIRPPQRITGHKAPAPRWSVSSFSELKVCSHWFL